MATVAKPFWQSKTIILNIVGIIVIFLQVLPNLGLPIDTEFQALILAIVNVLNRFQTSDRVSLR